MKTREERELAFRLATRGGRGRKRVGVLKRRFGTRLEMGEGDTLSIRGTAVMLRCVPLSRDRRKALYHKAQLLGVGLLDGDDDGDRAFVVVGPPLALFELIQWASNRPAPRPETRLGLLRDLARTGRGDRAAELKRRLAQLDADERPICETWEYLTDATAGGGWGKLGRAKRTRGPDDKPNPCPALAAVRAEMEAHKEAQTKAENRAVAWVATLTGWDDEQADMIREVAALWFRETTTPPDDVGDLMGWADENVDWE